MASTVIKTFRYQPIGQKLDIEFVNGRWYRYHGVPLIVGEGIAAADSKAAFFNDYIRDRFTFTRAIHVAN